MHAYGPAFYRYAASFAVASAERIVTAIIEALPIQSVVDFGCAQGAWLSVWSRAGVSVTGVDGPYVDLRYLMIHPTEFVAADLSEPINLGRQFDLVQSLEVAEHLRAEHAERFIDTLIAHGPCIMFSAAVPGQGGEHHINEQPLEYWRSIFRKKGYVAVDYIRPLVRNEKAVQYWYRYNTILYVRETHLEVLPETIRRHLLPDGRALQNHWPILHRARQKLLSQLPVAAVDSLSRAKSSLVAWRITRAQSN